MCQTIGNSVSSTTSVLHFRPTCDGDGLNSLENFFSGKRDGEASNAESARYRWMSADRLDDGRLRMVPKSTNRITAKKTPKLTVNQNMLPSSEPAHRQGRGASGFPCSVRFVPSPSPPTNWAASRWPTSVSWHTQQRNPGRLRMLLGPPPVDNAQP